MIDKIVGLLSRQLTLLNIKIRQTSNTDEPNVVIAVFYNSFNFIYRTSYLEVILSYYEGVWLSL